MLIARLCLLAHPQKKGPQSQCLSGGRLYQGSTVQVNVAKEANSKQINKARHNRQITSYGASQGAGLIPVSAELSLEYLCMWHILPTTPTFLPRVQGNITFVVLISFASGYKFDLVLWQPRLVEFVWITYNHKVTVYVRLRWIPFACCQYWIYITEVRTNYAGL